MAAVLRGPRVVLRSAEASDVLTFAAILTEPAVAPWFGAGDPAEIAREWIEADEAVVYAYERVGFRRVGVMRSYERGVDGTWHDNVLMDMLAGELRPPFEIAGYGKTTIRTPTRPQRS